VHRCIEEGLVGGDNFAVDANRIDANANRGKGEFNNPVLPKAVLHRRAVQEYIVLLCELSDRLRSLSYHGCCRQRCYPPSRGQCHERKKIEMSFAHLKAILKLDGLRLRGPCGANDEFLLAVTAQNLRKMAKLYMNGRKMSTP